MAKIIVCSAQKGGCAKTVTTHNLSVALSLMGYKVLAVDMDCQANLTTCLGIENVDAVPIGIAHLLAAQLEDEELPEKELYIQHCGLVDLIPASSYLSAVSETMRLEMGSERFLDMILEPLKKDYDFILVDTGPKLDNLNINALVAADQVLIPVNPQFIVGQLSRQIFMPFIMNLMNVCSVQFMNTLSYSLPNDFVPAVGQVCQGPAAQRCEAAFTRLAGSW